MSEPKKGAVDSAPKTDNKGVDQNPPSLQEQVDTLLKANKTQEETIVSLQKELADLQKQNAEYKDELEDASDIIEDLKSQPKAEDKSKGKTVTVDKKKYLITGGFRAKDRVYLPEDIAADEKLVKKLIEKRSGLIKEV